MGGYQAPARADLHASLPHPLASPRVLDETCWAMVRFYDEKARAIAVSNYEIPDLKELLYIVSLAIT